jgi:hypothetical protein
MTATVGRAYQDMAATQIRLAMTMGRTMTDAWLLAARRQQDALFGAKTPARFATPIANDAGALHDAAQAARAAGLDFVRAQAQALEALRRSA